MIFRGGEFFLIISLKNINGDVDLTERGCKKKEFLIEYTKEVLAKAVGMVDFERIEQDTEEILSRIVLGSQELQAEGWQNVLELQLSLEQVVMQ